MWSENDDENDSIQTVRLYQPILYGRKPTGSNDLTLSFVGGDAIQPPECVNCKEPLKLLAQLHLETRTLQVLACNRAGCYTGLFSTAEDGRVDMLCHGGGGVVRCRRIQLEKEEAQTAVIPPIAPIVASISEPSNEWTIDDVNDEDANDLNDLESKLEAMMESKPRKENSKPKKLSEKEPKSSSNTALPCFYLHSIVEPPDIRRNGMDDDDVGMGSSGSRGDAKIRAMLKRYMENEDDPDILGALSGSKDVGGRSSGGGNSGRGGERDERLSASDRALLTYSDRLKRSSGQVIRYVKGGSPIWSIPTEQAVPGKNGNQKAPSRNRKVFGIEKPIPPCNSCGTPRVFELQLVPPLLHALKVDKYAPVSSSNVGPGDWSSTYESGGMDWGNIAVYSCPNAACSCLEEYCVLQDSLDERPTERHAPQADVVIAEDAKFDLDEEDDCDEEIDCEDDGMVHEADDGSW